MTAKGHLMGGSGQLPDENSPTSSVTVSCIHFRFGVWFKWHLKSLIESALCAAVTVPKRNEVPPMTVACSKKKQCYFRKVMTKDTQ